MRFDKLSISDLFFANNSVWIKCLRDSGFSFYKRGCHIKCRKNKSVEKLISTKGYEIMFTLNGVLIRKSDSYKVKFIKYGKLKSYLRENFS